MPSIPHPEQWFELTDRTKCLHRLPTSQIIKGQAPATMRLVGVGLAGPAAGEPKRYTAVVNQDITLN